MLTWGITAGLALITVLFIVIAVLKPSSEPEVAATMLANVAVETVVAEEYWESLILPAKIEADRKAVVSAEVGGRLQAWLVGEGDRVEQGEIVAELDTSDLKAELEQARAAKASAEKGIAVAAAQVETAKVALEQSRKDAASLELELESAESQLELARKEYTRIQKLTEQDIATEADLDTARNRQTQARLAVEKARDAIDRAQVGIATARARVSEAEARLDLARNTVKEKERRIETIKVKLEKTTLHAPISGRLEEYIREPGEYVNAGESLATIYDLRSVRAVVDVADRYIPFLDTDNETARQYISMFFPGAEQAVRARLIIPGLPKLTGGRQDSIDLAADIARIAQAADPRSNTFEVELRLENPGGALKEGLLVQAHIDYIRYANAYVIPLKAVQVSDSGPRVLIAETKGGKTNARSRPIEPVSIKEDRILVGSGVTAGDRLIVSGGRGVLDGEEVRIIMADGEITDLQKP